MVARCFFVYLGRSVFVGCKINSRQLLSYLNKVCQLKKNSINLRRLFLDA